MDFLIASAVSTSSTQLCKFYTDWSNGSFFTAVHVLCSRKQNTNESCWRFLFDLVGSSNLFVIWQHIGRARRAALAPLIIFNLLCTCNPNRVRALPIGAGSSHALTVLCLFGEIPVTYGVTQLSPVRSLTIHLLHGLAPSGAFPALPC